MYACMLQTYKYIRNFNNAFKNQIALTNKRSQADWKDWLRAASAGNAQAKWVGLMECRPSEELYYLADDPDELNNIVNNPVHEHALIDLRARMRNWMESQGMYTTALALADTSRWPFSFLPLSPSLSLTHTTHTHTHTLFHALSLARSS